MAKVVLARDWYTPQGRFRKLPNNEGTYIPDEVLKLHKLPKGAFVKEDDMSGTTSEQLKPVEHPLRDADLLRAAAEDDHRVGVAALNDAQKLVVDSEPELKPKQTAKAKAEVKAKKFAADLAAENEDK